MGHVVCSVALGRASFSSPGLFSNKTDCGSVQHVALCRQPHFSWQLWSSALVTTAVLHPLG